MTLESPLNRKEIQPVHPKGNQPWIFICRTDAEAEAPILWLPDAKGWLIWKDPDAGKDWGQEEKGTTEDEVVRWHHWLNGHGFGWTLGVGDGQGGLACCGPWGCKELDMTERLKWTESSWLPSELANWSLNVPSAKPSMAVILGRLKRKKKNLALKSISILATWGLFLLQSKSNVDF